MKETKSKNGRILVEKTEILNRWKEYTGELFGDRTREVPKQINELSKSDVILLSKFTRTIEEIATMEAAGEDEIVSEYLKSLDTVGKGKFCELFNDS